MNTMVDIFVVGAYSGKEGLKQWVKEPKPMEFAVCGD